MSAGSGEGRTKSGGSQKPEELAAGEVRFHEFSPLCNRSETVLPSGTPHNFDCRTASAIMP
ncbi:MAG TPA: hypothetical protein P5055_06095, partial [Candidatus Paceibacterota bacterium]|nr:hypothetical protein [Candidatus Paceibacterota bacterium]